MKNNFKKLTRNEQLMVNGGDFGPVLYCKKKTSGFCVGLAIPNGQPCVVQTNLTLGQGIPSSGGLICSGTLGGAEVDYNVGNNRTCVCG